MFRGGLPRIELEQAIEMLSEGQAPDLTLDLIPPRDVSTLLSYGHDLEDSPAILDAWTPGTVWESRERLISGSIAEAQPNEPGQPISIRIAASPGEDANEFPPTGAIVDEITFGHFAGAFAVWDQANDGKGYQWIIGRPGVLWKSGTGTTDYRGSLGYVTAYLAGTDVFVMIAGHQCDDRIAPLVRLIHGPTGTTEDVAIISPALSIDGRGRRVAIAHATGAVAAVYAMGDPIYVRWIGASGLRHRAGPLTRSGDVLTWALRQSSLKVDWARTATCAASLPWRLDGYWDQRVKPWAWVRDNLLPILPISIQHGPDGLFPVRWWWQGERPPLAHLEAGRNARLLERPVWEGIDREVSEVEIAYAVGAQSSQPNATLTVSAARPSGARQSSGLLAHRCREGSYSYTSGMIWAESTAGIAARTVLASKRRRLVVPIQVDPKSPLDVGDPVDVSLPAYSLSRVRGTIRNRRVGGAWTVLEIVT
jgi:hypothetical protein